MSLDARMRSLMLGGGDVAASSDVDAGTTDTQGLPEEVPVDEGDQQLDPDPGLVPVARVEDVVPPQTPPPSDDPHGARAGLQDALPRNQPPPQQAPSGGRRKRDMTTPAVTPSQKLTQAQILEQYPHVAIKLYRYNHLSGQRVELGSWHARDQRDVFDRARWVAAYSGGGQYVMSVHPPSNFATLLGEFAFELPGQPLDPAPMREERDGAKTSGGLLDGQGLALLTGGAGGKLDMGSLLLMSMLTGKPLFGQQASAAPATPVHDPEVASLRAGIDALKTQLLQQQADAKVKEADDRHAREMSELKAELQRVSEKLNNPPKQESALEKLAPHLPTAFTLLSTVLQQGQARTDSMLAHFDRVQAEDRKLQLEMLKRDNGQDPTKMASAMGLMANQFAGLLGTTAQALKAVSSGEGPSTAQVIGEIGGRILEAGQQVVPMLFALKAAKESPEAAAAVAGMFGGQDGSPQVPPGAAAPQVPATKQPPTLPQGAVQVPRKGTPPVAAAPAAASVPTRTQPEVAPDRRFPAVFIHRLVKLAQARVPPELLVTKSINLIGVNMEEGTYPPEWDQESWWQHSFDDLPACLSALAERIGISLHLDDDYATVVRDLARRRWEEIKAYAIQQNEAAREAAKQPGAPSVADAAPAGAEPQDGNGADDDDDDDDDDEQESTGQAQAPVTEG